MLTAAAVVACALDLLGRSASTLPPIEFVSSVPPGVSRNAEAYVRHDPDVIVFVTTTDVFRRAQRGPYEIGHREACRKVASVLVHEEWHLRHGPSEESAYLAQLTALAAMGAESSTISGVRRAMQSVLAAQRKLEKAARHAPATSVPTAALAEKAVDAFNAGGPAAP